MRSSSVRVSAYDLLPEAEPVRLLDETGVRLTRTDYSAPGVAKLAELYRQMVIGRQFDRQAAVLARQGRLAVYPSSYGQEACQVGVALALEDGDWMFPTYRESVALITRGVDPVEALTLLRGDWHCGYDPYVHRTAPQCTPLATSALHAVGLADAARRKGDYVAVLAFLGDGATSEGDAHEAFNFAAVFDAPVVFFVQNNQWAISVPRAKQSKAPTLAHKGIGYGICGHQVDGNDAAAVYAVVSAALAVARAGRGPSIVEGLTYRLDGHTNSDDATRYRVEGEVDAWLQRDPVTRLEKLLRAEGVLDKAAVDAVAEEAEEFAAALRAQLNVDPDPDPAQLFTYPYTDPPAHLRKQAEELRMRLATEPGKSSTWQ